MTAKTFTIVILIIVLAPVLLSAFVWRDNIRIGLTYGWDTLPTHAPQRSCSWTKKVFDRSGISFFLQNCPGSNPLAWSYSEDSQGDIWRTNEESRLPTFKMFRKQESQAPNVIMDEWYAKLTPEQRKSCAIQSVDEPVEYSKDGTQSAIERPHPTEHKTRYGISVRPEIIQGMLGEFDGLPTGAQYDFLCGPDVGARFISTPPYFEFDDRSPGKYLFVGSLGNDDFILVDLNSIRF